MNLREDNWDGEREKYLTILNNILGAVKAWVNNFDIFAELVSSTVWKSPKWLAPTWIERVASSDWNSLQDTPGDDLVVKRLKFLTRTEVLKGCAMIVHVLAHNPTFLQRMTTRLAIRDTLAIHLEPHDQDRMIATELWVPYMRWKQLLGALSHVELPEWINQMNTPPIISLNDEWMLSSEIVFSGHVEFTDNQPAGIELDHGVGEYRIWIGAILALIHQPISVITVSENVMNRFENIIPPGDQERKIRSMVLHTMSELPAWKRRSIGGNKPEKKEAPNLSPVWNPMN